MAVEAITDPGVFLPILVALVVPFMVIAINKFTKTSETTLTGTIKLEGMKSEVSDMKADLKEGFDKMENLLNRKDEQNRTELLRVWNRIEEMNVAIKMNTYKLDDIQKKKNGGPPL